MSPTDSASLPHHALSEKVIGAFFTVYWELGYGFLESVYESALCLVLSQAKIAFERQAPLQVHFRGMPIGLFRPDLLVEGAIVVELKACRAIEPAHQAQLLNCLKATGIEVGLLFNFGPKPTFKRMAVNPDRNPFRVLPRTSAANSSGPEPR